jgi:hypothetical protein
MCECAFETKCKYDAFGTRKRKKKEKEKEKEIKREREVVVSKNGCEEKGKKYWSGERLLSKWVI